MSLLDRFADSLAGVVSRHSLAVILVVLLLTAGVAAGIPQLDMADQTNIDDDVFNQTDVGQALQYTNANYSDGEETALSGVYFRPEDGNALARSTLVTALSYEQRVRSHDAVTEELVDDDPVRGPPRRVGTALAGPDATLDEQIAAIETADDSEFEAAVRQALSDPQTAGTFLPRSYEPGTTEAESMRVNVEFEQAAVTQQQEPLPDETAQQVLYDTAAEHDGVFTLGTVAQESFDDQQIQDVFLLIVPPALLLVLAVLAFAYRDIVDVLLGFFGVCVSLVWFFGILGWLGIPAGFASIVGPVLIVALSIDFGLHVFMRYREQRTEAGAVTGTEIRAAMARSTASVTVAFLLVAVTAGVGFLANVTSPIGFIRAFGVVITLGVLSAVLVFVTLVPALKIRVDGWLEGRGIDRGKPALGSSGRLRAALTVGVTLARRAGLVVIVLAVVAGGLGLVAYTEVDRQGFQEEFTDDDDWQTALPGPIGWSAHETEYGQNSQYVREQYQSNDDRAKFTTFLIRADPTETETLALALDGERLAAESDLTFEQNGAVPVVSPLSIVQQLAIENERFAGLVAGVAANDQDVADLVDRAASNNERFATAIENSQPADTGGDITDIYDAMYAAAPADTAQVLERTDGEYRSMRVLIPVEQGLDVNERGEAMHDIADDLAAETDGRVDPVGFATVSNAGLGEIADSILLTMVLAFGGVAVVLGGMYRFEQGSATLGLITVVPMVVIIGLVFAGMSLFEIPLTFITAFLVSITIGLGIDYNIHISDRFATELDSGTDPVDALETTVTGTGGALLGSALTSSAAFATLLAHPAPMFQSFGFIVVVAMGLSFVTSVVVFPSLLLWWARLTGR
jgi:predicted RND superfamily exporter protein